MERFSHLQTLTVRWSDTAIIITIARPKFLNALNKMVLEELDFVLNTLLKDGPCRFLVITGEGTKAFVAGADIGEMLNMTPQEALAFSRWGQEVFTKIETYPLAVVAAINGYALGGGCELAAACDIRIASKTARFGQPEVGLGIIPGFGGTQRLGQIVGKPRALDLILSGRIIGAQEALRIGLVHKVVDEGKALEETLSYLESLSKNSLFAQIQTKKAMGVDEIRSPKEGRATESDFFSQCFGHKDQKEGMAAFLEKRPPKFDKGF